MAEDKKTSKTTKTTPKKAAPAGDETAAAKSAKKSASSKPVKATAKADTKAAASKKPAKKAAKKKAAPRAPLSKKTFFAKNGEIPAKWRVIDAEGKSLGRLSSYIATALMGKDKPAYTPHADTGDFVVVINAEKVKLTGKKWDDKNYFYHTGYAGGIKQFTAREMREKHPERLVKWAVHGMLPATHLGRKWMGKMKVYAGTDHPHSAQQPQKVSV